MSIDAEFKEFEKIARLSRECCITEKIDGTNAQIYIVDLPDTDIMPVTTTGPNPVACRGNGVDGSHTRLIYAGSRNRWITPTNDNHGFARWVEKNADELSLLGPGRHYGEWWGSGIQRGYGLINGDKRFSLFNTGRWKADELPLCVGMVPVLYTGIFSSDIVENCLKDLEQNGSKASNGFMKPEGVVIYLSAARKLFKKTLENDGIPKGMVKA